MMMGRDSVGHEAEETEFELKEITRNENQEVVEELDVTVKGMSQLPFWKHDLKFKAAIALIETIDLEDYNEDEVNLYYEQLEELKDAVMQLPHD